MIWRIYLPPIDESYFNETDVAPKGMHSWPTGVTANWLQGTQGEYFVFHTPTPAGNCMAAVEFLDDGALPTNATIHQVAFVWSLGAYGSEPPPQKFVNPYVRYAGQTPRYMGAFQPAGYPTGWVEYIYNLTTDPDMVAWTPATVWAKGGNRLRVGLLSIDSADENSDWHSVRFSVNFTLPSPTVTTGNAVITSPSTADLTAVVNPNTATAAYPVSCKFEWGTTTAYGNTTTPVTGLVGSTDQGVTTGITGLTSGTTYHFRAVAYNADVSVNGADNTFVAGSGGGGGSGSGIPVLVF